MRQRIMTCLVTFLVIGTATVRAQFAGVSAESELRGLFLYGDHGVLVHYVFGKYHPGITAGMKWRHDVEVNHTPLPDPIITLRKVRSTWDYLLFPLYFDYGARAASGPKFSCRTQLGFQYKMLLSTTLTATDGNRTFYSSYNRKDISTDRIELLARAGLQWKISKRFLMYAMGGYYTDFLTMGKVSIPKSREQGFSFSLTFHYATKKG